MTEYQPRWRESKDCSHSNDDVCPFCDFDGYYERRYPTCPWRKGGDPE